MTNRLTGQLYAQLCECLYFHTDELVTLASAFVASDLFERAGRRGAIALPDALLTYAFGVAGLGRLSAAFAARTRLVGQEDGSRDGEQYALGSEALAEIASGRPASAIPLARTAVAVAKDRRSLPSIALARTICGLALHHTGAFREAVAEFGTLEGGRPACG